MANVNEIHAASNKAREMISTGITYFHVRIFSSISAFRMPTRVVTNCLISSLVSARIVAIDFSVCTSRPPDSQPHAYQKPQRPRGYSRMHRVLVYFFAGLIAG